MTAEPDCECGHGELMHHTRDGSCFLSFLAPSQCWCLSYKAKLTEWDRWAATVGKRLH